MEFSQVVRDYRKTQGLTLRDFARAIDVSHQSVAAWENATRTASKETLVTCAVTWDDWRRAFALAGLEQVAPEVLSALSALGVTGCGAGLGDDHPQAQAANISE